MDPGVVTPSPLRDGCALATGQVALPGGLLMLWLHSLAEPYGSAETGSDMVRLELDLIVAIGGDA